MSPMLVAHVAGGGVGLLSGAMAICAAKGGALHRAGGTIFTGAMLIMAASATILAITIPDRSNLPGGVFSFYLLLTAWAAARAPKPARRPVPLALIALGLVAACVAWKVAQEAHCSVTGEIGGKPVVNFIVFAGLATFAVVLDVRMLIRGLPSPRQRTGRHIWRMCTALFFATGSFFLGQQKVMPSWAQESPLLIVPAVAPLFVMVFWLVRNRLRHGRHLTPVASSP